LTADQEAVSNYTTITQFTGPLDDPHLLPSNSSWSEFVATHKPNVRETLGLAGEYAVASELCRRGLYAQLTLGHHKKTDLIVETKNGFLRLSVKSKRNGSTWRNVTGIWQRGDRFVFVDYKNKEKIDGPDFYILSVKQWKRVMDLIKKRHKKRGDPCKVDTKTNTLYWPPSKKNPKGWKGCSVSIDDVSPYKNRWPSSQPSDHAA
jgi:hypothetical protein